MRPFQNMLPLVAILFLLALSTVVVAQDAAPDVPPDAEAVAVPEAAAAAAGAGAAAAVEDDQSSSQGFVVLAVIIALFVVPMFLGNYFSNQFRMPDHSWKFSLAIGTLAAAAVVVAFGQVKFGPDLSGGITLIYELQDTSNQSAEEGENGEDQPRRNTSDLVDQLIAALGERVDPSGTKEVTIRKYGDKQIEIIIPKQGSQQDMDYIMRRISTAGALEFRITASPEFAENKEIIEVAQKLAPGINDVRLNGKKVAKWVAYQLDEFGPVDQPDGRVVKRMAGETPQALILTNDGQDVTGDYLSSAAAGVDPRNGSPAVNFTFDTKGAYRFGRLSGDHIPNAAGQEYFLGIVLDEKLISAPSINEKIRGQGQITGRFTKESVDFLVGILNAGSLPATLNSEPISSTQISPTVGAETVEKGRRAIVYSLVIVMVFMAIYYRFAGIVACLALGSNLLLILGLMILLKAAFTLPGLAGLVLTIGMSVDANVLIFERIREELSRGTALRMAIRNGFARATQTIVDANVTTLITAIIIYKIAPDNVKGFGVTLILGIVMSMYSAIFLSRIVFDVAERTRRLKALGMRHLIGHTNFDFISKRMVAAVFSMVIIAIGVAGISNRGGDMLNIDFTGGSSVTMVLNDDQPMPYAEVKKRLDGTELVDKNLSLVEVGETDTSYTVSSVEQDIHSVQQILQETFGDQMKTHQVELEALVALPASAESEAASTPQETSSDSPADAAPESDAQTAVATDPFAGGTSTRIKFRVAGATSEDAGVNHDTVLQFVQDALNSTGHEGVAIALDNEMYQPGSARRFDQWDIKLALPTDAAGEVLQSLQSTISNHPIYPLASKIGGRVAGNMTTSAIAAVVASLVGIVAYIWFRFHGVIYGLAAVVALVHDVAVTLGAIALSAFVVNGAEPLASGLMIEKFQLSLPIVAALLTIIGYSLNDTIVVFDRIREVKGKSPNLTANMINSSINQTLSRTLLTSMTTLLTVLILYFIGGDGIHGFAFSLVVGVVVGTYSSIFVASPVLLWMSNKAEAAVNSGAKAA